MQALDWLNCSKQNTPKLIQPIEGVHFYCSRFLSCIGTRVTGPSDHIKQQPGKTTSQLNKAKHVQWPRQDMPCALWIIFSDELSWFLFRDAIRRRETEKSSVLKALDTSGIYVKDQSSHLVYPNACVKKQSCENSDSIGHQSCKRIMKEITALLHKFVCFQKPEKGLRITSF